MSGSDDKRRGERAEFDAEFDAVIEEIMEVAKREIGNASYTYPQNRVLGRTAGAAVCYAKLREILYARKGQP